ncbi:MAG: class IV adenylate cyclase [Candidatus Kariarchaeaceae archaeon]|jgi:adenylate cyclase class 2
MIEVEIKLACDDPESVITKLKEMGAEQVNNESNMDIYFNHPVRDFGSTDEALRIREVNSQVELTYKGPKFDSKSKTREEITIPVESLEIKDVFYRLNFPVGGIVNKKRDNWTIDNVKISIDQVENLGDYVELEISSNNNENIEYDRSILYRIATSLGLNPENQIRESYLELLRDRKVEQ